MSRYLSSTEHTSITHAWICLNINLLIHPPSLPTLSVSLSLPPSSYYISPPSHLHRIIFFLLSSPSICFSPNPFSTTSTSFTGPVVGPQSHVAEASLPRHGGGEEAALRARWERPRLQQRPHPGPPYWLLQHGSGPMDTLLLQPPHGWAKWRNHTCDHANTNKFNLYYDQLIITNSKSILYVAHAFKGIVWLIQCHVES